MPDRFTYFTPAVGDLVEFESDRQTEKGPSSGRIVSTNGRFGTCVIQHSDDQELFFIDQVKAKRLTRSYRGEPLWILE